MLQNPVKSLLEVNKDMVEVMKEPLAENSQVKYLF